jgi:hypothetical protein
MNGYISIVITVVLAVIALYAVTAASYVIYCAIKANVTHDKCYDSMYKKGQAIACLCPGKSEPRCTDCPYFTYMTLSEITKKFIDYEIDAVMKELEE